MLRACLTDEAVNSTTTIQMQGSHLVLDVFQMTVQASQNFSLDTQSQRPVRTFACYQPSSMWRCLDTATACLLKTILILNIHFVLCHSYLSLFVVPLLLLYSLCHY